MFQIGDKVFYPMHGAGVIEAIEEKEFLGEKQLYYVLSLYVKPMHVMIPMDKTSHFGIRLVVESDIIENVLNNFHLGESELTTNPIQRQRINMARMKSGDIYEGAQVIRDLMCLSKNKKLTPGDKTMLDNARQVLISELIAVKNIPEEQAAGLLNQVINN